MCVYMCMFCVCICKHYTDTDIVIMPSIEQAFNYAKPL